MSHNASCPACEWQALIDSERGLAPDGGWGALYLSGFADALVRVGQRPTLIFCDAHHLFLLDRLRALGETVIQLT